MDIRHLNHFIALAEERRFAAAAERVHLSQAAFSRSIQALEARLGVRLFDRSPQAVSLTSMGEAVLERARAILFDSNCLVRDIELMRHGDAGELVIGAAPIPAATLLPALLARLRREHPQLVVRVRMGKLAHLLEQLDAQELDFCFGDPRLVPADERRSSRPVAKVHGGLFCRADHPLAQCAVRPDAAALRRYGIACISISQPLLDQVAKSLGFASAKQLPLAVECDDVRLLAQLVGETDIVGVLPLGLDKLESPALRALDGLSDRSLFADVHAIWRTARTLSPSAREAITTARAVASEALGTGMSRRR